MSWVARASGRRREANTQNHVASQEPASPITNAQPTKRKTSEPETVSARSNEASGNNRKLPIAAPMPCNPVHCSPLGASGARMTAALTSP